MNKTQMALAEKSAELINTHKELSTKCEEHEQCEEDLYDAKAELAFQTNEKKKHVVELSSVTKELKQTEEELARSKTQTSNFAQHLNYVQEEEKAFLAREIHDEFGQQLAGMKMKLHLLKRNKNQTIQEVEGSIDVIMEKIDVLIQALREIATALRPGILDTLGLIPSLEWQAREFERHTDIKCSIEVNVMEEKFAEDISICFFRICQETLTNISKYAKAKNVKVTIFQNQSELSMIISDDGIGISKDKINNPFSMGLLGMKERAKIIGADLSVTSEIEKGTVVTLRLALSPAGGKDFGKEHLKKLAN